MPVHVDRFERRSNRPGGHGHRSGSSGERLSTYRRDDSTKFMTPVGLVRQLPVY